VRVASGIEVLAYRAGFRVLQPSSSPDRIGRKVPARVPGGGAAEHTPQPVIDPGVRRPTLMGDPGMAINEERLNAFLGKAVGDLGAAVTASLMLIGDRLGLFKALAESPATPAELARRTGTNERYVREWLAAQAAGGYVGYDAAGGRYALDDEQKLCLADPDGPVDLPGAYFIVEAVFHALDRTQENFRTGKGMEWGEHHPCLFHGTERFFRAGYNANLLTSWLPAFEGLVAKLRNGGKAADVGCGHGASTILLAQAFPQSEFVGVDYHEGSIQTARERAASAGVRNARFEVADATGYADKDFDLVAFFDCLHDMGDPVGAAKHARAALKPDGHCMLVEPIAGDRVEDNLNPVGRVYYGASTQLCVPVSLARSGPALGAQAGLAKLSSVITEGGFSVVRQVAQTPFNMILEARP
jgi:SAM-dependent methyltransferase